MPTKKKKSSMRDFYCNYAHFWFLFLGGLDCVFLWVGWNQEVLSLYWSRGDVQQSFLSWILERLHDLTVLLLGGLLLVLFSFFVCTFHFLNNPNACNIAKKKSHLLMNLPENIWRRLLSSLRPPAVYLKRKKKKDVYFPERHQCHFSSDVHSRFLIIFFPPFNLKWLAMRLFHCVCCSWWSVPVSSSHPLTQWGHMHVDSFIVFFHSLRENKQEKTTRRLVSIKKW